MNKEEAASLGVTLTDEADERFRAFTKLLLEYNEKVNLTAITDPDGIDVRHYQDSVSVSSLIPAGASVVDVGCGAGFPGYPLRFVREDIRLTLMDALEKRVKFLEAVRRELSLEDVCCLHLRAEDAGRLQTYRERFDVAVSRAVAALPVLAEYCLPLVRVGGSFLALKGPAPEEELLSAKEAIRRLGGELTEIRTVGLPGGLCHSVVCIRKISQTPPQYPRKAGKPAKDPLK